MLNPPQPARRLGRAPSHRNRFIGRVDELDILRAHLETPGLTTLVGPPGVGKTRLALELADTLQGTTVVADMTEARSVDDVLALMARTLGVSLALAGVAGDRVVNAIAALGPVLVVIDNFEQVVAHGQVTVARWLDAAPDARFLVTSREALRLVGERRVELAPLSTEQAIALFVDRASCVRADFDPTDSHLESLVDALDRLPLAIELAAARSVVLSPSALTQRLTRGIAVLRAHEPERPSRQATLRGAIGWSWDLLEEPEKSVLAQCAVFRGGFTIEAAEHVIELPPSPPAAHTTVLDVMHSLVDKSLVHRVRGGGDVDDRLGVYASVRHFVAELPDHVGAREATERRHALYYADAAQRWVAGLAGRERSTYCALLEADLENLRAALDRSETLEPVCVARLGIGLSWALDIFGPFVRQLDVLARAASVVERHPEHARLAAELHATRAEALITRGLVSAGDDIERALSILARTEGPASTGQLELARSLATLTTGDATTARRHLRASRDLARAEGDDRVRLLALMCEGLAAAHEGRYLRTQMLFGVTVSAARRWGFRRIEGRALNNFASIAHLEGHLADARRHFGRALAIAEEGHDRLVEAWVCVGLALLAIEQARYLEAGSFVHRGGTLARNGGGGPRLRCFLALATAILDARTGAIDNAREGLARAVNIAEASAFEPGVLMAWITEGTLDVTCAQRASANGDTAAYAARLRDARCRLDMNAANRPVPGVDSASLDVRLALRLLASAIDAAESTVPMEIAVDGMWFRHRSGELVRLGRRRTLARLLAALAATRVREPGRPVCFDELRDAGWPDEQMLPESAARRIYVAMAALRKLGLKDELLTDGSGGYLLDPKVPISVPSPATSPGR